MAEILTKKITRDKLARIFKNQEMIKLIEDLTVDVGVNLSDSVNTALTTAQSAQSAVEALEMALMQQFSLIYDQDADPPTVAYLCEAAPGTASSAAAWRIQKLTFGTDGDVSIKWADGNTNFDNVADNRASLTYTF